MYCIFRETTQILTSNIMYAYTLWICIQPRKVVNQIIIQNKKPEKLLVIWLNGLCVLYTIS